MNIVTTGGPYQDLSGVCTTKAQIADLIQSALFAAGWSAVSGGSGDWTMQCPNTTQNMAMRVRVWDPGGGQNSARVQCFNEAGAQGGGIMYLFPEADTWRVIAHPHQAFVCVPGLATPARKFASFGVPYVLPSMLLAEPGGLVSRAVWWSGNGRNDTDTAASRHSFRTRCEHFDFTTGPNGMIISGNVNSVQDPGVTDFKGMLRLSVPTMGANNLVDAGLRFINGDYAMFEARMGAGQTGPSDAARFVGWLWDAMIITAPLIMDTLVSYSGVDYAVITHNSTAGTLIVRIP